MIKNSHFSQGSYRARATIVWKVATILSLPVAPSPFLSRSAGEEGGWGEGEGARRAPQHRR